MASEVEELAQTIFGDRAYWPVGWEAVLQPVADEIAALRRQPAERELLRKDWLAAKHAQTVGDPHGWEHHAARIDQALAKEADNVG